MIVNEPTKLLKIIAYSEKLSFMTWKKEPTYLFSTYFDIDKIKLDWPHSMQFIGKYVNENR